ncbi:MAG: ATP-dependent helicase, partial [Planctomycetales bacterium]
VAYLRLVNNPRDDGAFLRVVNNPPRGIGPRTIQRLEAHAKKNGFSLLEAAAEAQRVPKLAKRAIAALTKFVQLHRRLDQAVSQPLEEILGLVLSESSYQEALRESESLEDQQRLSNVEELLTVARTFDEGREAVGSLENFLETICLVSDVDDLEAGSDRVSLMTLHASKGLEFPVVFLVALEEGILPHESAKNQAEEGKPESLEEERRLCFVGMTRAKEELRLSRAKLREFRGRRGMTVDSSFLWELPREEIEMREAASAREFEEEFQDWDWDEQTPSETRTIRPSDNPSDKSPLLMTAAELAGETRAESFPYSVESFHQNMPVTHPEYGLGKIIALSGQGRTRQAVVRFVLGGKEQRFFLVHSKLRPAVAK